MPFTGISVVLPNMRKMILGMCMAHGDISVQCVIMAIRFVPYALSPIQEVNMCQMLFESTGTFSICNTYKQNI